MTRTAAVCSLLMDFALGIMHLAIPLTAVHLDASALTLGLAGATQRVGITLVGLVAGPASDRWGRKRLVLASVSLLSAALLLMATATSLEPFIAWVFVTGIAVGLFWSPIQAWIGDAAAADQLGRSVARFNVAWSVGALLGTLAAGALFSIHRTAPFFAAMGGALAIFAMVVRLPEARSAAVPSSGSSERNRHLAASGDDSTPESLLPEPSSEHQFLLTAGRLAVFAPYFIVGAANNIFPKLADGEGFSAAAIGLILAFVSVARTGAFCVMGVWEGWQFRARILAGAMVLAGLGSAGLAYVPPGLVPYALCFSLVGLAQGAGYAGSLFYALHIPGRRGKRSGLHEFYVNAGAGIGALLAGAIAQGWGLRAPFVAAALLPIGIAAWIERRARLR